ncbi:hypothetical protein H1R20_g8173, partial [Candolleomyces eurysporus]
MSLALLNEIITNPAFHDYLAILKGARNGFVYGVKVRFPHALVMSILFGRGDWQSRARVIFRATKQHAFNLAKFVTIYKSLLLAQKKFNQGKERSLDTFIAGLIGGYVVFGERNAVNEQVRVHDWAFLGATILTHLLPFYDFTQIVLYVVSRVVASFIPRASAGYHTSPDSALSASTVKPLPPRFEILYRLCCAIVGTLFWHNT